ncbi:hypothetical protein GEV33_008889 [Tenebrio molitor]|uniref:Reverse transcriptase domain-containing protein n=1 Tax=Tenebrio molitor TaxID=7067 RepID=A0A8J6HGQ3_TENMO|nr:hypothetical protein GEV33_008889 [Tenebrio molitor]
MVKYRRRLAQYRALIQDERERMAPELGEDTLSPVESPGRLTSAAAPPSTPPAGLGSPASRSEPLGPALTPAMGSTRLGSPPMPGLPDQVVWVDPPLGGIANSPGLHFSQVAGGSSVAAPLHMDLSTSDCPPSSDVSPTRGALGSPVGGADSFLALVSPESTSAFARDNQECWQSGSSFSQRSGGASQSWTAPLRATNASSHGGDSPSPPATSPNSGDNGPDVSNNNFEADHPVYDTLRGLIERLRGPGRARGRREVLRLASGAVRIPMGRWGEIIDNMIFALFPAGERVETKRRAAVPGGAGASSEGAVLNRSHRMAAQYKKAQDLYSRHPRVLADLVVSGASMVDSPVVPGLEAIMELHGGLFEAVSPPDPEEPARSAPPMDAVFGGFDAVTLEELRTAKARWPRSAPGMDGVTVGMVMAAPEEALLTLYNMVLSTAYHPTEWRAMKTVMVPKGGNREGPANWRPITIGSALQRLLHRVLNNRLRRIVHLNNDQRGFVQVDGTLANILILQSFLDHSSAKRRQHALASLDLRKAFDSVSHHSIAQALSSFGVPAYLADYVRATFRDASTTVFVAGRVAGSVEVRRGVRQGDPLSPMLFNMVVDELLDLLRARGFGAEVAAGERCPGMAFADDFVLLADNRRDLQGALDVSEAFFQRRGMSLNPSKSRVLVKRKYGGVLLPDRDPELRVCRSVIPAVDDMNPFKYLGFLVGTSGVTRPCLSNYPVWMSRLMTLPLKPLQRMNLLRTHLLPRLFHGLQNNKISAANLKSIDRVTRHYVKRIAHLHLHTSDALIHAPLQEGGLGITELRVAIPYMFRSRIVKLREGADHDPTLSAALGSPTVTRLLHKLDSLCGDDSPAQHHRRETVDHPSPGGVVRR